MPVEPLYLKLKEQIRKDLEATRLEDGSVELSGLKDLETRYGASRPTISKAITALAAEGFLIKQAGRGAFVVAPLAAPEPRRIVNIVGFVAPLTNAELSQRTFRGIDRAARRRDYRVLMAGADESIEHEQQTAEEMIAFGASGLVIYPTVIGRIGKEEDYLFTADFGVPVVLIDTCVPAQGHMQVVFDNKRAGYDVTEASIKQGHTRIAIIVYDANDRHMVLEARLAGYLDALRDNGIPFNPSLVYRVPATMSEDNIDLLAASIVAQPNSPTSIIAPHDPIAMTIIKSLRRRGYSVPGEINVSGFDNRAAATHFDPPFTTTNPDFCRMGEIAADLLFDAINQVEPSVRTYVLPAPIIIGDESVDRQASNSHIRAGVSVPV